MTHRPRLDGQTLLMVAWSVTMTVTGQLVLRRAMAGFGEQGFVDVVLGAVVSPLVWAGALLYLMSTVTWLVVLSRIDLSVAYPMGSMNYVLVVVLSATLLDEDVGLLRLAGLGLILVGILVVARAERRAPRPLEPIP